MGKNSTLLEISKHPLLILLIGTLLGSVLIPEINRRSTRARELEELRAKRVLAAVEANSEVDRHLNLVLTSFESFWKDTAEGTLDSRRPELRTKVYGLYEEFDRSAWWWFDQAWQEATILGLLEKEDAKKERAKISSEYKESLLASVKAIDPVWHMSLRQSPPPSQEEAAKALDVARQQLWESRTKRLQALARFTNLLMQRGSEPAFNPVNAPDANRAPRDRRR